MYNSPRYAAIQFCLLSNADLFKSRVHRESNEGLYPSKPRVRAPVHNGSDDISGVLEILNDFLD